MSLLTNPILVILESELDGKFYPAVATEPSSPLPKSEKFNHLFRGNINTYLKKGFETKADAENEIMDVLSLEVTDQICVSDVVKWSGKGHPGMQVHIERKGDVYHLVT